MFWSWNYRKMLAAGGVIVFILLMVAACYFGYWKPFSLAALFACVSVVLLYKSNEQIQETKDTDHGDQKKFSKEEHEKINKAISEFDRWFMYAENIGISRLQSFLQTGTILFAGSLLLFVHNYNVLAIILLASGLLFSIIWLYLGIRQSKFHELIDNQARKLIWYKDKSEREFFPLHHVQQLKEGAKYSRFKKGIEHPNKLKLGLIDGCLASRRVIWIVPGIFVLAYFFVLVFAIGCNFSFLPKDIFTQKICHPNGK
jgi:hypothetical protein